MPTLVTGGTGFLGVNLVRSLVHAGERVRVLARPSSLRVGLDLPELEFVTGDVTDAESVRRAMKGCDVVFHLAGWVRLNRWQEDRVRAVNVSGTEHVCRAALELGVRRMIHTSSIAAIGHGPPSAPATEETEWNFGYMNCPYYRTKLEAEGVVRCYVDRGLDAVIVNPGGVVGPYDVKPGIGRVILLIMTRRLPGYPSRGGISFVDVREVVEGMRAALDRGRRGERYILSNENMTYGEFVRRIARIAGVAAPRFAAPYWMMYAPAAAATAIGRLRGGWFVEFNLPVLRTGFCEAYVSAAKARRELGVRARSVDQAVADAIAWFETHGYVRRAPSGWIIGKPRRK